MRSRIAITALLATGALMSSGGAALGISALSTTETASQAQYGPVEDLTPSGNTLAGDPAPTPKPQAVDRSGVKDSASELKRKATATVQPARQLEANGREELPFSGYAAVPLLLAGLAVLASGLLLRRSSRREPAAGA